MTTISIRQQSTKTTHESFCTDRGHDPAIGCISPEAVVHGVTSWYYRIDGQLRAFAETEPTSTEPLDADGCRDLARHFAQLAEQLDARPVRRRPAPGRGAGRATA